MALAAELVLVAGEPLRGIWCDRCLLPSAVTVPVYITRPDGSFVGDAGVVTHCPDCDGWPAPDDEEESG